MPTPQQAPIIKFGDKFKTIKEAVDHYWNSKYMKLNELAKSYPHLSDILLNYFDYFFNLHYPKDFTIYEK